MALADSLYPDMPQRDEFLDYLSHFRKTAPLIHQDFVDANRFIALKNRPEQGAAEVLVPLTELGQRIRDKLEVAGYEPLVVAKKVMDLWFPKGVNFAGSPLYSESNAASRQSGHDGARPSAPLSGHMPSEKAGGFESGVHTPAPAADSGRADFKDRIHQWMEPIPPRVAFSRGWAGGRLRQFFPAEGCWSPPDFQASRGFGGHLTHSRRPGREGGLPGALPVRGAFY